ncbi:hypothetical protein POVCU1_002480 [Plasmodium ovale curtisi]|uniref:Uncharacterized protein n=1 Tax=Plasmodium ovale curtisi TaxID=864141 RepID=A0A1A8VKB4_PLAOA|nr:hypothetical protein POVCU1_002480 [Plasmodium ovale curtisi]
MEATQWKGRDAHDVPISQRCEMIRYRRNNISSLTKGKSTKTEKIQWWKRQRSVKRVRKEKVNLVSITMQIYVNKKEKKKKRETDKWSVKSEKYSTSRNAKYTMHNCEEKNAKWGDEVAKWEVLTLSEKVPNQLGNKRSLLYITECFAAEVEHATKEDFINFSTTSV